ncbi:MAG: MBL fold metallo-hydrolase [Gammaproteobacteria bacterium]|nr:MBL fold metallo-hydrolase [Gammaproteobacteria bacterium]
MNQWHIGDVKITRIIEMQVTGGSRFILPDATRDACLPMAWMQPHFMDAEGNLIMSIHALIVDTGTRKIVVDTCIGNDKERSIPNWSHLQTTFLDDIAAAGYARESIDTVMCTHLHVDHVGWNTMLVDGEWVPTFPNARYLVAEKEWSYWDSVDDESQYGPILADSVRPVIAAGLMDFVALEHEICEGIRLEPTPGHTPGHVSVHITSKGEEALITGDCVHHPCQMAHTDWCSSADYDQDQGRRTRESLLENYVDRDVLIIGTHFATPTAGHIKRLETGGYWLDVGDSP